MTTPDTHPGLHRLTMESKGPWTTTWVQPKPEDAWLDLERHSEPPNFTRMAPAGVTIAGPTRTFKSTLNVSIEMAQTDHISIDAFPLDGSHPITVFDGEAGPAPTHVPTRMLPDTPYVILFGAGQPWHARWTPRPTPSSRNPPPPTN